MEDLPDAGGSTLALAPLHGTRRVYFVPWICEKHAVCRQLQQQYLVLRKYQSTDNGGRSHPKYVQAAKLSGTSCHTNLENDDDDDDDDDDDEYQFSAERMYGGGPGSRRQLHPIELKLDIIRQIEMGQTIANVAKTSGLSVGLVSSWWIQRAEIQEKSETMVVKSLLNDNENDVDLNNVYFIKNPKNKKEAAKKTSSSSASKEDLSKTRWPSVWEDLGVPSPSNQAKAIRENDEDADNSGSEQPNTSSNLKRRRSSENRLNQYDSEIESDMADTDNESETGHRENNTGVWRAQVILEGDSKSTKTDKPPQVRKRRKRSTSIQKSKGKTSSVENWSCKIMSRSSSEESSGSAGTWEATIVSGVQDERSPDQEDDRESQLSTPESLLRESSPEMSSTSSKENGSADIAEAVEQGSSAFHAESTATSPQLSKDVSNLDSFRKVESRQEEQKEPSNLDTGRKSILPQTPEKEPKSVRVNEAVSPTNVKTEKPCSPSRAVDPVLEEPAPLNFLERVGSSQPDQDECEESTNAGISTLQETNFTNLNVPDCLPYEAEKSPEKAVSPPSYPLAPYKLEPDTPTSESNQETESLNNQHNDMAQTSPINYNRCNEVRKNSLSSAIGSKLKNLPGIRLISPSEAKSRDANSESSTQKSSSFRSSTSDVIIVPQVNPDVDSNLDIVEFDPDPDPTQAIQYIPNSNKEVVQYEPFIVTNSQSQQNVHQATESLEDDIEVIEDDDVILLSDEPDEYNYPPVEHYDTNNSYSTPAVYPGYQQTSASTRATLPRAPTRRVVSRRRAQGDRVRPSSVPIAQAAGQGGRGAPVVYRGRVRMRSGGRIGGARGSPRGIPRAGSGSPRVSRGGGMIRGIQPLNSGTYSARVTQPRGHHGQQIVPRGAVTYRGPGPNIRRAARHAPAVRGGAGHIQNFTADVRGGRGGRGAVRGQHPPRGVRPPAAVYQQQSQQKIYQSSMPPRSVQPSQMSSSTQRPAYQPTQMSSTQRPAYQPTQVSSTPRAAYQPPLASSSPRGAYPHHQVSSSPRAAAAYQQPAHVSGSQRSAYSPHQRAGPPHQQHQPRSSRSHQSPHRIYQSPADQEARQSVNLQVTKDQIQLLKSLGII